MLSAPTVPLDHQALLIYFKHSTISYRGSRALRVEMFSCLVTEPRKIKALYEKNSYHNQLDITGLNTKAN